MVSSPTVQRRRLGAALRRLRENAGRTHREVASHLDCSQGKISQIELGRVPVRTSDVRLMAEFFDAGEVDLGELTALAQDSKQRGWWEQYPSTAKRPGYGTLLGLETAAAEVTCLGVDTVPELLRTPEYESALLTTCAPDLSETEREERRTVTAVRQRRLTGEAPLRLHAVLDEGALRRVVGGSSVLRAQLEHLVLMSYRRNVTLQVLPFGAGAHRLLGDRPMVFAFGGDTANDTSAPPTVHLGDSINAKFLDAPEQVRGYLDGITALAEMAMGAKGSAALISGIADGLR